MSEDTALEIAEAERDLIRDAAKATRAAANHLAEALVLMCSTESDGVRVPKSWKDRLPEVHTTGRKAFDLLMEFIEEVENADQDALVVVVQTAERDEELT